MLALVPRSLSLSIALSFAVGIATVGCGPEMPDQRAAIASYRASKVEVDAVAEGVTSSLGWMANIQPYDKCEAEDQRCREQRVADRERLWAEIARWQREVLPGLVRGKPILGLVVKAQYAAGGPLLTIGRAAPTSPGVKTGSVPVENGVDADPPDVMGDREIGRKLGWGLYQTAVEEGGVRRGDGAFHRGIEVAWSHGHGSGSRTQPTLRVDVRVVLLTDGFRRPDDWL
jgi:hypothetical protein